MSLLIACDAWLSSVGKKNKEDFTFVVHSRCILHWSTRTRASESKQPHGTRRRDYDAQPNSQETCSA